LIGRASPAEFVLDPAHCQLLTTSRLRLWSILLDANANSEVREREMRSSDLKNKAA
jgi:hypothetical protein